MLGQATRQAGEQGAQTQPRGNAAVWGADICHPALSAELAMWRRRALHKLRLYALLFHGDWCCGSRVACACRTAPHNDGGERTRGGGESWGPPSFFLFCPFRVSLSRYRLHLAASHGHPCHSGVSFLNAPLRGRSGGGGACPIVRGRVEACQVVGEGRKACAHRHTSPCFCVGYFG